MDPIPDAKADLRGVEAPPLSKSFFSKHQRKLAGLLIGTTIFGGSFAGCERASHPQPPNPITSVNNQSPSLQNGIPSSLNLDERVFAIGNDTEVFSNGAKFGEIEQTILSWGTQFRLYDTHRNLIATAKQQVFSWGVKIDIYDSNDTHLGTVNENIIESMFSIKSQYRIDSPSGEQLASSEKLDFFGTDVTVYDEAGNVVATMTRPMFNVGGDKWTVSFSGNIDRRLLVFIPAYKTAADNQRE